MTTRIFPYLFCIVLSAFVTLTTAAEVVSLKIGLTWPRELLSTDGPSGDAEVNWGLQIDRKVAFGISGNFLWNIQSEEERVLDASASTTRYKIISEQKTFMFPVMGFFQVDPIPEMIVHPVARFQIGYNSMIYSFTKADVDGANAKPVSPYFYGLITKLSIEGVYDFGENSAMFLGMEYRWANTKTVSNTKDLFDRRNMGGIEAYAGFRLFLG